MQSIISYSKLDQHVALKLYKALITNNIDTWIDRVNILPGQDWEKTLEQAIKDSSHMLLLLSEDSIRSTEVEAEWNLAKSLNIVIVPILLTDVEVPFRIRSYQHLQFQKLDWTTWFWNL